MSVAVNNGLAGVVAKQLTSPYRPGQRTREWIKTPINKTIEVLIGWKPGAGRRAGLIGSLLLGAYTSAGQLSYLGKVGTGFTDHAPTPVGPHPAPPATGHLTVRHRGAPRRPPRRRLGPTPPRR
jgi:bifunctional non-homologous end joining protein LigD